MIATGLVFALGVLVATLVSLLLVPLLWRRAQRLAWRDFNATMPATTNEIRAEVDKVRAEAAVNIRRNELLAAEARESAMLGRAEVGRLVGLEAETGARLRESEAEGMLLKEEIAALNERLQARDATVSELEGAHQSFRLDAEQRLGAYEEMHARFRELEALADERLVRLVAADTRVEQLTSDLRAARADLLKANAPTSPAAGLASVPTAAAVTPAAQPVQALVLDAKTKAALDRLTAKLKGREAPDPAELRAGLADVSERILSAVPPAADFPPEMSPAAPRADAPIPAEAADDAPPLVSGEEDEATAEAGPADDAPTTETASISPAANKHRRGGARARRRSRR